MEVFTKGSNTYQLFKLETNKNKKILDFIWGKHDIRCVMESIGSSWQKKKIQLKHENQWFDYKKVSAHGIAYDETQWQNTNDEETFIELPKKFDKNLIEISIEVIKKDE